MTDNEILLAMSNLLEPIRNDIQDMKGDIQDIKNRVKKIEIAQENVIVPRLQNIEAYVKSCSELPL